MTIIFSQGNNADNNTGSIGFPDWNNYISWENNGNGFYNNSWVAPDNGFFFIYVYSVHENPCNIYINDIKVNYIQCGADGLFFFMYPVSKGDVLKIVPSGYMPDLRYTSSKLTQINTPEIRFFYCRK